MSWNNDITLLTRAADGAAQRLGIIQFEPVHPRHSGRDETDKAIIKFPSRSFFGCKDYKRAALCPNKLFERMDDSCKYHERFFTTLTCDAK